MVGILLHLRSITCVVERHLNACFAWRSAYIVMRTGPDRSDLQDMDVYVGAYGRRVDHDSSHAAYPV